MEKFTINCSLNLEKEIEVIAENETEAYELAKEFFTDNFTDEFLDSGMDFEILTEDDLTNVEYKEFWNWGVK